MIIVDTALRRREERGEPIRVGMVGAGFMGRGVANQICNSTPGMRMSAIQNRHVERALDAYRYCGIEAVDEAATQAAMDAAVAAGRAVVSDDPFLLCRAPGIDAIIDVTGSVEFGARVALEAFAHGKPVILMNAEVDATLGPILQVRARAHGVRISACDGDEPALQMNLYRWVRQLGLTPRVVGNVKGLQDPYRTPDTQQSFARKWGQDPVMVTAFADGSKISCEQAIVGNATGFGVRSRGMSRGEVFDGEITELPRRYDLDALRAVGGVVDYTVGPAGAKVFCLAEHPDPKQRHYLKLYKLGEGPLYTFWTPYHLVHFEAPITIARLVDFGDEAAPAAGGPVVEVCSVAKRALSAGEILDDYGGFMTYGEAVNSDEMSAGRYLPHGLVEGCRLRVDVARDAPITYDDVELPPGRVADRLRAEQYRVFRGEDWLEKDLLERAGAAAPAASLRG